MMAARPRNQVGDRWGDPGSGAATPGIARIASFRSSDASALKSERSQASMNRASNLFSETSVTDRTLVPGSPLSKRARSVQRARCRALFTLATEHSRESATSRALHARTSRRSNTARCLGGRSWITAMKASATLSFISKRATGSAASPKRRSG